MIQQAEGLLRKAGVTEVPRLEAEVLLADLLDVERATLIASYFEQLNDPERTKYFSRVIRRTEGEPVGYITGKKEFMGALFRVDRHTLIPRPETETLVEHIAEIVEAAGHGCSRILEIGTGCGCIAVSLALILPTASIHATDISPDAIYRARCNAEELGVVERIAFYVGNVFSALPPGLKHSFDFIVSNPPYISDSEYATLDRSIRIFEPPAALRGGVDGLDVIRQIAAGSNEYLVDNGLLAIEVGERQAETVVEMLASAHGFEAVRIVRDLAGRQRVVIGRKAK